MSITSTSPTSATPPEKSFGFWGNLKLPRKFMLIFGVVMIFTMLAVGIALWGLNRVEAGYEHARTQGNQIQYLSEETLIYFLQARRQEKNFINRWEDEGFDTAYANYVTLYKGHMANMRGNIELLAPFGPVAGTLSTGEMTAEQYDSDIASLIELTNTYDQNFLALVDALEQKGADENSGMELTLRDAAHAIEEQVAGKEGLEQLEITLLQIRRNEKDYLLRGNQEYVDNIHSLAMQLKAQAALSELFTAPQKTEMNQLVDKYTQAFDALVDKDREIAVYNENMIASARAVEPFALKIEKLGEQLASEDFASAHTISTQTFTTSAVLMVAILVISIFLSIVLSRQITLPVTRLTNTAEEISAGNFDAKADVVSGDEIGTLAQTFNTMTSRLRQALEDVRRRALAVQTSAEVSHRLSAATSTRQLAVETVEQLQSAFHYYHAHIYFVDEESGDLIMAGGTGVAGTTMLARGHKVQKGHGLVGRAAETNTPVLVPDVSQEAGWLPNPLLPETKSEASIPITLSGRVVGVLDVQQNLVNGLSNEDVDLLESIAGQVAISLQNTRTFEDARAKAELETLVNTIGQKIQRAATMEDTLQTAVREIGLALGASRVSANINMDRKNNN